MALPTIKGYQIDDETVTRDDINTSVSGKAVIAKIIEQANSGVKIYSSTGADSGTGDVKLMVDTDYLDGIYLRSYTLPTASSTTLGGIKVGTGLTISSGVLSTSGGGYTLPTASSGVLGGVKIGSGITITSGVISTSYLSESSTGKFLATPPYPASGSPAFRILYSVDLPDLPISKLSQDSPSTHIDTTLLGSGTASSTTYLRGDNTWQTISAGGVTSVAANNTTLTVSPTTGAVKVGLNLATANTWTANITAPAFYESSSRKLKRDIKLFRENATDLLTNIKVKQFSYKSDPERLKHVGIIAEENDELFTTPKHNAFDLASSLAILIKGFQELERRVSKLEGGLL